MSGLIPERILEEVAYRNDIVDIVGARVQLKRSGSSLKGLCPFHQEKTPSFHVNPQRQSFHCFGCGAQGNVFKFVMMQEGLDFVSAVKALADRAGVAIEVESESGAVGRRKALQALHAEVAAKYRQTLLQSPAAAGARAYLEQRGLTGKTIDDFQIGYAPDAWDSLLTWARKKNYTLDQLVESGLVVERRDDAGKTTHYDRFRDRIMFPIFDAQGRVVAFSGRTMAKEPQGAKYVNSPETPIFQKSRVLYGMHLARAPIVEARQALVCEGQIDVIRCHQAGFAYAVASQGTAFTEEHVALLKRCTDSIVLAFDGDDAGRDAAIKTGRLFVAAGLAVRVVRLPAGEDPDSFIRKKGAEEFRTLLDEAPSAVAFHLEVLAHRENLQSEAGALRAAREMVHTIAHSPNAVQRSKLTDEAARLLGLPPEALASEVDEALRRGAEDGRRRAVSRAASAEPASRDGTRMPPRAADTTEASPEELLLCEQIVHAGGAEAPTAIVAKYLPLDMVRDPLCRALLQAAVEAAAGGATLEELVADLDASTPGLAPFMTKLAAAPDKVKGRESGYMDVVREMILALWRRRFEAERAALGDRDPERRVQLTYDLKALRSWAAGCPILDIELLP